MKFLLEDAKDRYKKKLGDMEADKVTRAGANWESALLGFFFDDINRARFSVRDTLIPMLEEDHRVQDHDSIEAVLRLTSLDESAGAAASRVFTSYVTSQPLG